MHSIIAKLIERSFDDRRPKNLEKIEVILKICCYKIEQKQNSQGICRVPEDIGQFSRGDTAYQAVEYVEKHAEISVS